MMGLLFLQQSTSHLVYCFGTDLQMELSVFDMFSGGYMFILSAFVLFYCIGVRLSVLLLLVG